MPDKKHEDEPHYHIVGGGPVGYATALLLAKDGIRSTVYESRAQVVVRSAGHIVPGDQPERAMDMITRFIEGTKYEHLPDPVPHTAA